MISAIEFFQGLELQLSHFANDPLDETDQYELWIAVGTAREVLKEGDLGYRRAQQIPVAEPTALHHAQSALTYKEAVRMTNAIRAGLVGKLETWSSGETSQAKAHVRSPTITRRLRGAEADRHDEPPC